MNGICAICGPVNSDDGLKHLASSEHAMGVQVDAILRSRYFTDRFALREES